VAIWLGGFDLYAQLAAGDPDTVKRFAPRVAAMAAAAGKQRASAPLASSRAPATSGALPSSHSRNTSMTTSLPQAAPQASRAAQAAEIHRASINASRRRVGLAQLTAAEVTREFADLDRLPPRAKVGSPRTNTNAADSMWTEIVGKHNASLEASRTPIGARRASPAPASTQPAQRAVNWSEIASELNEQAGLKTTVSGRAR
jgi:hypothetical protein